MTDYHEVRSNQNPGQMQSQMRLENVSTLQALYTTERHGERPRLHSDAATAMEQFEGAWQSGLTRLKESLRKSVSGDVPLAQRAQAKIMEQELDDLNHHSPQQRLTLFHAFKKNVDLLQTAASLADKVQEAIGAGYLPAAEAEQKKVVAAVSDLDKQAIQALIQSTQRALTAETDPQVKAALQNSLADSQALAAAPFIEKARLAAILLQGNKFFQGERALNDALTTDVTAAAWDLKSNQTLRANVRDECAKLNVQNNLPALFEQNLKLLDTNGDGSIDTAELKAVATTTALTKFLGENFDYLTRHHWPIISRPGISRDDINQYAAERAKQTNDLRLP